jgi:hypothetical protein
MNKQHVLIPAALLAVFLSTPATAEVVVDWDLTGLAGTETTQAANSAVAGVTGNALTEGATLTANTGRYSMNAKGWNGEATDYFSFGFTVANGYSVDLTSLAIGSKSSSTGPGSMGLYYSGDNFASVLYTFTENGTAASNDIVDLSGLTHLSGTVEFRIAQIGTTAANGDTTSSAGTFRITGYFDGVNTTNLQLNGSVAAVPEANTYAMMLAGLGLVGFMGRRRRA